MKVVVGREMKVVVGYACRCPSQTCRKTPWTPGPNESGRCIGSIGYAPTYWGCYHWRIITRSYRTIIWKYMLSSHNLPDLVIQQLILRTSQHPTLKHLFYSRAILQKLAWRSRECGDGDISSNSPAKETSHFVPSKIEAPRVSGTSSVAFSHSVAWKRLEGWGVGWIGEQRNPTCLTYIGCKCKHIDVILYDIQIFLCDIYIYTCIYICNSPVNCSLGGEQMLQRKCTKHVFKS